MGYSLHSEPRVTVPPSGPSRYLRVSTLSGAKQGFGLSDFLGILWNKTAADTFAGINFLQLNPQNVSLSDWRAGISAEMPNVFLLRNIRKTIVVGLNQCCGFHCWETDMILYCVAKHTFMMEIEPSYPFFPFSGIC